VIAVPVGWGEEARGAGWGGFDAEGVAGRCCGGEKMDCGGARDAGVGE